MQVEGHTARYGRRPGQTTDDPRERDDPLPCQVTQGAPEPLMGTIPCTVCGNPDTGAVHCGRPSGKAEAICRLLPRAIVAVAVVVGVWFVVLAANG